jgi:hypothetical protein
MTVKNIEVIEIQSGKDLKDFIRLPDKLYSRDPFYVPLLKTEIKKQLSDKNPFFLHAKARYFLAQKSGETVGRIASIVNQRHIEFRNEKSGFFGFFESVNDYAVSDALLNRAAETLGN